MLKKLLQYDFKAILKYWWIAALTTFGLSFAGAGCGTIIETDKPVTDAVYSFAIIGMILVVLSFVAFVIFSELLIYIRFYKHLFTDEGYLTFTLPVKRQELVASKLITGSVTTLLTAVVTVINASIVILTTFKDDIFYKGWFEELKKIINETLTEYGTATVIADVLCIIAIALLSIVLTITFTYLCLTIAAIISKKAKVITAVGIYYAATSVVTVFVQIFNFFGVYTLEDWIYDLPTKTQYGIYTAILILVIFILAILCSVFYTLQNWLVDRKLNLS